MISISHPYYKSNNFIVGSKLVYPTLIEDVSDISKKFVICNGGWQGRTYRMDYFFYSNLMKLKKAVEKKNFDMVGILDGEEGSGKSTLGGQILKILDPNFSLNDVFWDLESFQKRIDYYAENKIKFKALMLDETREMASSERSMSKDSHTLKNIYSKCRKLNLYHILILPSYFELDKNLAVWRSRWLAHSMLGKNLSRGKFNVYNKPSKKRLYLGRKTSYYSYRFPKPDLVNCVFDDVPVWNPEEYDERARAAIAAKDEREKKEIKRPIGRPKILTDEQRLENKKLSQSRINRAISLAAKRLKESRVVEDLDNGKA